jgi:hypothetical protein
MQAQVMDHAQKLNLRVLYANDVTPAFLMNGLDKWGN